MYIYWVMFFVSDFFRYKCSETGTVSVTTYEDGGRIIELIQVTG